MIVLYHNGTRAVKVISNENKILSYDKNAKLSVVMSQLAFLYPDSKIVWCNEKFESNLNLEGINAIFHHNKMMMSYNPGKTEFLGQKIGYVDESPFIKINKDVSYPTWQMSSLVGIIHASVLLEISKKIKLDSDFDYYLNSLAKVCTSLGLLCYSEPKLLLKNELRLILKPSNYTLFRFVKQHYRMRWIFLLFLNFAIYEFRFLLLPLLYSFFFKNRNNNNINLDFIKVCSSLNVTHSGTIDVIIPTIGREQYLYNVLKDLSRQTYLPKNVIIVEQNPLPGSVSVLNYLTSEDWPFVIKHTFTHQAGACNARNVALNQVESEWVFLNDDDNRFEANLLEEIFLQIKQFGTKVAMTSYLQKNEILKYCNIHQSRIFGSGNSVLKAELLKFVSFDMALEFGFGEDADYGMQLRNIGADIIYFPTLSILHLKAPVGGFRVKPVLAWENDSIQPKPSPTLMHMKMKHSTIEQLLNYKTILFLKTLKNESISHYFIFFKKFKQRWESSTYWAIKLRDND